MKKGQGRRQFHERRVFGVDPKIAGPPVLVTGEYVAALVKGLRLPPHGEREFRREDGDQTNHPGRHKCSTGESISHFLLHGVRGAVAGF